MTKRSLKKYHQMLLDLRGRLLGTTESLEEVTRTATGGEAGGNLSNAPMHLGDLGTAVYTQELNATLLENESYLLDEVTAALGRIDAGTYGRCERCGTDVIEERLEAIPYTRFCAPCSAAEHDGAVVNFNEGRPENYAASLSPRQENTEADGLDDDEPRPFSEVEGRSSDEHDDVHAAGTPGGGSAVGGLAGTNVGDGSPDHAGLEHAMGSGNFDAAVQGDEGVTAYAGPSGGAVGGTPAGKRAGGGKAKRGAGE